MAIARDWRDGDRVEIDLPMRTRLERLPDGSDYAAVMHGPILPRGKDRNRARRAHRRPGPHGAPVGGGPYEPLDAAPMLVGDVDSLAARVQPVAGRAPFQAPEAIRPAAARDLNAVPFFRVHDSRYVIYWRVAAPQAYERVVTELREEERARLRLEARTLDRVVPGEQQSEVDHGVPQRLIDRGAQPAPPGRSFTRHRVVRLRPQARHVDRAAAADRHLPRQRSATAGSGSAWTIGRWRR